MANISTAVLLSGSVINEAGLNKKREEEKKAPIDVPFESGPKERANYDRVEKNLQIMLDSGATPFKINQYLVRTEGLDPITVRPQKMEKDTTFGGVTLALARGAVTGAAALPELPLIGIDFLGFLGRKSLDIVGVDAFAETEFEQVLSGHVMEGARQINRFLDQDDLFFRSGFEKGRDPDALEAGFVERTAEKVGEYVVPGAMLTKGLTGVGAALLRRAPESLNIFQKIAVNAAKDPMKLQAIEAGINSIAAISGESTATAVMASGSPEMQENVEWFRFGSELTATFGAAIASSFLTKVHRLTTGRLTLTESQQKRAAELRVGEIFNEWMAADPNTVNNLKTAARLEREIQRATGDPNFRFTTADVLQHPEAQAAMIKIIQTGKDIQAATRYLRTMESNRKGVSKWIAGLTPVIEKGDNLQKNLDDYIGNTLNSYQKKLDAAEVKALEEAIYLHPERGPEAAGQHAIQMLDEIFEAELDKAIGIYNQIDRTKEFGVSRIRTAVKKAQFAPQNRQLDPSQELVGLGANDPVSEMIRIGLVNFGDDVKKTNIGRMLAYRRLIGKEINVARNGGNPEDAARLITIRDGIDNQFSAMEKTASVGKEARLLKKANEMRRQVGQRFESARAKVIMNKDLNGINTLAPEDVMDRFIRAERGKAASRSATLFKQMFGDSVEAKKLITDTVDYELSKFINSEGRLNPVRSRAWLNSHKQNLQKHGVWDQYKDVDKAELAARRAKDRFLLDRRTLESNQLNKIVKAENLSTFIGAKIKAGRIAETRALVESTGDPMALRAFKREVWDSVLRTSDTSAFDTVDQMIRNPGTFLKTIQDHADDLKRGLGEAHYKDLEKIARGLKLQEGNVGTFGIQAVREAIESHGGQQRVGRMMSKVRASMQGFVSPTYTAVQLLNEGLDHISVNAAVKTLQEASYDWRIARRLAKEFVAEQTRRASKSNALAAGLTTAITTENYLGQDDARTEE